MINKPLFRNFSWTFVGNVIYTACQWGIIILLAKIGSTFMVGQFSLALAVTAPVYMYLNLQLRAIQATDATDQYSFNHYIGLRIITTSIAVLLIFILNLINGYNKETAFVILLVGVAKGFESISDIVFGVLQKNERMDLIAKSMMIKGPLSLTVIFILMWFTHNIITSVAGLAVSWLMILLIYDLDNARKYSSLHPLFNLRELWPLVRMSLPLGLVMMLISLNTNIPRYFIEHDLGIESLGYFTSISYLIVAGTTVINALGQSASPRLAKFYANGKIHLFRELMIRLIGFGLILGFTGTILVYMFGKELLTLFYKPNYSAYHGIFLLVMISASFDFMSSFIGYGATAARYFKIQPYIILFVVIVNILSNSFLVPTRGLEGAAISLINTSICQFIANGILIVYIVSRIQNKATFWR